jgi:hypothetical protein
MRLPDLLALREAFILDRGEAELRLSLTVKAFCEERLELIESVLKEQAALRKAREQRRAKKRGTAGTAASAGGGGPLKTASEGTGGQD